MSTIEKINFHNFSPSPELVVAADVTIEWLLLTFRHEVTALMSISLVGDQYHCALSVESIAGEFHGLAKADLPVQAMDQAVAQVQASYRSSRRLRQGTAPGREERTNERTG